MNYPQVVDWLFSQLANYHQQGSTAYKPGLEAITTLLNKLGNPQKRFKSVHIAGTNGKGSTAHMITAMAIENGYKVGLFTSPHIKDFRERIKINGQMIEESFVVDFVTENKLLFEELNPSFFEITTAMAFVAFAKYKCDFAIIETGLGGRLDATNVLKPEIAVITNIGLDHTAFLGNTVEEIAFDKAGIIKQDKPTVIGEMIPETQPVFEAKAKEMGSAIFKPNRNQFNLDVLGAYQKKNAALAWETLQVLKVKGLYFDDQKSEAALTRIGKLTGFSGRLTLVSSNPKILVDASHNPSGIQSLMQELKTMPYKDLHCVYGSAKDKKYEESMAFFPKTAQYYLCSFPSNRAVSEKELSAVATRLSLNYHSFKSPEQALEAAKGSANEGDLILVFGSFYILEKII